MNGKKAFVLAALTLVLIAVPARAGELEDRQQTRHIAAESFIAAQYAEIDSQVARYTESAARTPSGLRKSWVLYNGMRWVIGRASSHEKMLVIVRRQSWSEGAYMALISEGLKRHPPFLSNIFQRTPELAAQMGRKP